MVKNAARPGGQGLNLCLFLVKSDFLVGGSGVPWHFLFWGFCLYGRRTLLSLISPQQLNTQASITKALERHIFFSRGILRLDLTLCPDTFIIIWPKPWPKQLFLSVTGHLVISNISACVPQNVLTCHYGASDGKGSDIQWPFHHCYNALLHPGNTQVIWTNDTTPARAPMS